MDNTLPAHEITFLEQIRQAAATNPFSNERLLLDCNITGLSPQSSTAKRLACIEEKLTAALAQFARRGLTDLEQFRDKDRELVMLAKGFHVFHRYLDQFDLHIGAQAQAEDEPQPVHFAKDALRELLEYKFTSEQASRYFAMFFQMRRAYYFISRIIGTSPCMQQLRCDLWNNIFTHNIIRYFELLWNKMEDFSTLILGDTGSGKGMAAAAIGCAGFIPFNQQKNRFAESFTKAFVSLNLSQFPEQLIESELFGHKKGAFTGAMESHHGIFAGCSPYGAILLDEIGEVSVPIQIKLLRILQERTFSPVGSHQQLRFQGRVITATNVDLNTLQQDRFRDDFYYRLCSDIITVPTLHHRISENSDELEELVKMVVKRILGSEESAEEITETINKQIPPDYPWPGNVRELEQCVRSILLRGRYKPAQQQNYPLERHLQLAGDIKNGTLTGQELLRQYATHLYKTLGSYSAVAERLAMDRRTVKKHIS